MTKANEESAEDQFASQCRAYRLPEFVRQLRFIGDTPGFVTKTGRPRQWRFDFAFEPFRVAVEIEGLVPQRIGKQLVVTGRHGTVKGIIGDMEKYNSGAMLGWSVLRFAAKQVKGKYAIENTMRMLSMKGWAP